MYVAETAEEAVRGVLVHVASIITGYVWFFFSLFVPLYEHWFVSGLFFLSKEMLIFREKEFFGRVNFTKSRFKIFGYFSCNYDIFSLLFCEKKNFWSRESLDRTCTYFWQEEKSTDAIKKRDKRDFCKHAVISLVFRSIEFVWILKIETIRSPDLEKNRWLSRRVWSYEEYEI